jgi:hypothetical protein
MTKITYLPFLLAALTLPPSLARGQSRRRVDVGGAGDVDSTINSRLLVPAHSGATFSDGGGGVYRGHREYQSTRSLQEEPVSPQYAVLTGKPDLEKIDDGLPKMVQNYIARLLGASTEADATPRQNKLRALEFDRVDHDSVLDFPQRRRWYKAKVIFNGDEGEVEARVTVDATGSPWKISELLLPGEAEAQAQSQGAAAASAPKGNASTTPGKSDIPKTFGDAIISVVAERKRRQGSFIVPDPILGMDWHLSSSEVKMGRAFSLGSGRFQVCAEMKDEAKGDLIDLDFILSQMSNGVAVEKVAIHKVNGKERAVNPN